jgi:hypothetical protein
MKTVSIGLLLTLVAISTLARADDRGPITAGEVASWCEPYRTAVLKGASVTVQVTPESQICYGAFLTIQQLAAATYSSHSGSILRICGPPTSGLVEYIKIFLRYSDTHPEMGHLKFSDVALNSLWNAFPCSPKESATQ